MFRISNPQIAGVGFKIASALIFTVMGALIKEVGATYPTGQVVAFRSLFALIPLVIFLRWQGDLHSALKTDRLSGHILRGGIGVIAMFLNFAGIARLPLADATAIFYAAPIFTVALAALLLKEKVRLYRWTAVAIGFFGVVLTLLPHLGEGAAGQDTQTLGAMFALAAAAVSGFAMIQVRRLTETEPTGSIVLYFSLTSAFFGFLTLPFGWVWPTQAEYLILIGIGILGGMAQICMTQSFRLGDASLIAPFEYASILFALLIGYLAFGEVPVPLVLAGAAIVVGAGVFVVLRERKLGLRQHEEPEVT